MEKIFLLLFLQIVTSYSNASNDSKISSEDKQASSYYMHLMNIAHPPAPIKKVPDIAITLSEPPNNVLFQNVNTIAEETIYYQSMQNESSIAINPVNPSNLIASAVDYRDTSSTHAYISHDFGKTWVNINLGRPYPGWVSSNDPSLAFDADGTAYLVYGGFGVTSDSVSMLWGENGVFIARSFDEGKTWEAHIPVIVHKGKQTLDSTFEDKYYISIDNSTSSPYFKHLYIPWKRVTPRDSATQIVISKSTDNGSTWSMPVPVSKRLPNTSEDTTYGQSFPLAATGPNGELYVVWNDGIVHGVGFAKSFDGGKTFSEPKIIQYYNIFGITKNLPGQGWRHSLKGRVRAEAYPVLICDNTNSNRRGFLYLSWAADSIPNVYFSFSTDGGNTWSIPVIVHSDTTNDQFWQWLSQDPITGDLAIMYLDSRNDTANILVECFVSYSSDGGLTWIDRQAADVGGDLRRNPFSNFYGTFAGDYSGCAFYNGNIYPSWIDMRNAADRFDSDVYTAIVNTRAPNPPENFKATAIPDSPDKLRLTWESPTQRAFGQQLNKSDFHYIIYRENKFINTANSEITEYIDDDLKAFEYYNYSIRSISMSDTSIEKHASAYAGGALKPAAPFIISIKGNSELNTTISIKLPSFRADNITPLSNLAQLELYRDGQLLRIYELNKSDTGKIINFSDKTDTRGFYKYQSQISAKFDKPDIEPQFSDMSNELSCYTGPVESYYSETFDKLPLPKYKIEGGWAVTDKFYKSPPYSITESPDSSYTPNTADTLIIFPFISKNVASVSISFWHAAINHRNDSAFVEYSNDNLKTWNKLAYFSMDQYPPWEDGLLNSEDWKYERFIINSSDTLYFRFRFRTNAFRNEDGWYIDDISIAEFSSIQDKDSHPKILLYPNPTSKYLNINIDNIRLSSIQEIKLTNIFGEYISIENNIVAFENSSILLDVQELNSGVYFIEIKNWDGSVLSKKFNIIR